MTDWNACKAACRQAAVEGRMMSMQSWEDGRAAELREEFPAWDIWYVRYPLQRRNEWCARPKGAPVAIFHAWDADGLASKIRTAEAEIGKP